MANIIGILWNDRHFTISSCYLFDIYVVYVLCTVRPNAHDEVKDETCEDVPVTDPTLALLISNRHIQAAGVVLESPSHLTNPSQACFVNYVLLLLPMFVMEQLCRLCAHLDFVDDLWTGLCQWLVNYVNYVDFVNYRRVWTMWTWCYMLCWSFVNLSPMLGIYELLYAMYMSQLYLCVKKCGRNGKKMFPGLSCQQGWHDSHHGILCKWLSR